MLNLFRRTGSTRASGATNLSVSEVAPGHRLAAQFPRPPTVIARRYAEGAICLAATTGDRFAGFVWLSLGPYEEDEVRCRFVPLPSDTTAWDFDVYVEPAFRRSRAFGRLWDAANDYLRERNIRWTLSRISAFNAESLRAHSRFGGRRIAWAVYLCGGQMQMMVSSLFPWVHASFAAQSRPELRVLAPATAE